ncbi:MAG: molybdopterin-dependent oxidoreductase [Nocardioidaceae bacterium]
MTPTRGTPTRDHRIAGGVAGLLAAATAVLAAEALSALLTGVTSPLYSVANRAVDWTPRPLKEWAVETLATADKPILVATVSVAVAVLGVVAGIVGVRRPRLAVGLFLVLSVVAIAAALTDRSASASAGVRLLPALLLAVVAVSTLLIQLATLRRPAPDPVSDATPETPPALVPLESIELGKPRMLLPKHVAGDDLPAAFDRRAFLVAALAVGAIAASSGAVRYVARGSGAAAARADVSLPAPASAAPPLPDGVSFDLKGLTRHLTPNKDFYRVDTALQVPDVPIDGYALRIHGMVDQELELSFEDLLSRRLVERRITLTCVSNQVGGPYVGNATWIGVPIRELLAEAGVQQGADAVKSTSADDFTIGTPMNVLADDRDALIAVGMNGKPLPLEHGFPVRMVTPGLYGYVSATKWLVDLEVTRFADFKAYWTTRGYAAEAPIKTSSRIDVPKSFARVKAGRTPVAGVAWSQNRGIDKVEVRVDGGEWAEARLSAEDNKNTWRQWMWEWDATSGNHRLEVRATDRTGKAQTSRRAPIAPDGSTGWHSVAVTVE